MCRLFSFLWLSFYSHTAFSALMTESKQMIEGTDFLRWGGLLVFVLGIFFLFIWFVRKAGHLNGNSESQMCVVAAVSLGAKERMLLVKLGEKQLVLGVCPGRIETLYVLEGDDCLSFDSFMSKEGHFAHTLNLAMQGMKKHE